ncbi:hypothetical protein [Cupriavidus sp. UYPR2.512]|uniref:hypothetical protein n=1 Tax=Cupriavidus sp. UYPR2.512 TaxID=1080187 RepID=UPI00037C6A4F
MMTKAFTREQLDTYFASFVGMEGGNPSAAVWFCDYSPTRSSLSLVAPLMPQLECPAWDSPFRARHAKEILRWQTHQRIAHIMSAAREMVLFGQEDSGDWKRYLTEHLYRPLGREFMLSLFPLPIRTGYGQSWRRRYGMQPELASRIAYMTLCREGGRFRFIEALRRRERPKVVVCLGERHEDDYVHAFGMRGLPYKEHTLKPADQARILHIYDDKGTRLVLCPALAGAAGMCSDVLLKAMGSYISQWLAKAEFELWSTNQ